MKKLNNTVKSNGRGKKVAAKSLINTDIILDLGLEGVELEPLRPQDLAKLIKAEQEYTAHVLATRPVYPRPEQFHTLNQGQLAKRNFLGKTDVVSESDLDGILFARGGKKNRNKGKGGPGNRALPSPQAVFNAVNGMVAGRRVVAGAAGMKGDLVMWEQNFEFGDPAKAKYFEDAYRLIVERSHLIFASEVDPGFLAHLATLSPGYKSYCCKPNTRNQAVGFVLHERFDVVSVTSHDAVASVQGVPDLRPAFELELRDKVTGNTCKYVVVHLKSMRGGPQVSGVVRRNQATIMAHVLKGAPTALLAGDWNTFLDSTKDLDPLKQAGFAVVEPNDTRGTHTMGGRLDGFLQRGVKVTGPMDVVQINYLPGLPVRAITDHASTIIDVK